MTSKKPRFRRLLWDQFRGNDIESLYANPSSPSPRRSNSRLLFWVVYLLTVLGLLYWLAKPSWPLIVMSIAAGAAVELLRAWREARRIMRVLEVAHRVRAAAP